MKRSMLVPFLLMTFVSSARAVQVEVAVTVHRLNPGGFVEFKVESDDKGEKATGHIGKDKLNQTFVWKWKMGGAHQNIWYWWDTLDGDADLKVVVTGAPGIPVTLWEAPCTHKGKGEQQVGKTLAIPLDQLVEGVHHYRRHPGMSPYITENSHGSITHIRDCDAVPAPGAGKGGHEWDLVWE